MLRHCSQKIMLLIMAGVLTGCAAAIDQSGPRDVVKLSATENQRIIFERNENILLESGYERTIRQGTTWHLVGRISEGDVFRPVDTVFTIEGRDNHEAYLVLRGSELQGFYLPTEETFSPMTIKIKLLFKKRGDA